MLKKVLSVLLSLSVACSGAPRVMRGEVEEGVAAPILWYEVHELRAEPAGATRGPRGGPMSAAEYRESLSLLTQGVEPSAEPMRWAERLLGHPREELFLAEVEKGQIIRMVPLDGRTLSLLSPQQRIPLYGLETRQRGLTLQEAEEITRDYQHGCEEERRGMDCLSLLEDGPVLQGRDLYLLALSFSMKGVVDKTLESLKERVRPQALVAMALWVLILYFMAWVLPEPVSKVLVGAMTTGLMLWTSASQVFDLVDGWLTLMVEVDRAKTFAAVKQAGEKYSHVLVNGTGEVLMSVAMAALGGAAMFTTRLKGIGSFKRLWNKEEAPGGLRYSWLDEVEEVTLGAEGEYSVLVRWPTARGTPAAAPGGAVIRVIRHRAGNLQVLLPDGSWWHVPPNKKISDIPRVDKVGDALQAMARRLAAEWGRDKWTDAEMQLIDEALKQGKIKSALLWESQARGRWVEKTLRERLDHLNLQWNPRGVDVFDPVTGIRYEILSGTKRNMDDHARRMSGEIFRMITF